MTQSNSSKPGLIHGLGLITLAIPMAASAQSTWTGATSANWNVATNWPTGGIPAADANIIIADTTTNGLTLNDGPHSVGSITIGNTGTKTGGFTFTALAANPLTIKGGITAAGNFTAGIGPRLRGHVVVANNQSWQVGGQAGTAADDRGLAVNESLSPSTAGSLTLNANLDKTGTGQLTFGAISVLGTGDINVNEGSLKLNAGGSLPLNLTSAGTGKLILNNSSTLIFSKNSGSFNISRNIEFKNTANVITGSGSANATGIWEIASNIAWNGTSHTITNNRDNSGNNVNFRFSGVMSGTGNLSKAGLSGLILSGTAANTLTGNITVTAGELSLDKTGVIAVPGNIAVSGGTLRINQANQIADTSNIALTGTGAIALTTNRAETIAALSIGSTTASNVSGLTVTGATTLTNGTHDVSAAQTFATNSLAISNNAGLRLVGDVAGAATANVGAGGLTLDSGKVLFENAAAGTNSQLNLTSDIVSTGASQFVANNNNGSRSIDLQGVSRALTINNGTLEIRPSVEDGTNSGPSIQNGTLVKSGAGALVLSHTNSPADFSLTDGPLRIRSEVGVGNLTQAGGTLEMDIGGASPAKITTTNFIANGGSIELSAPSLVTFTGSRELIRYNGSLVGTPTINIPASLQASRVNPVLNYGTGTNSAITVTSAALPLALTWSGANGATWNNNSTANFNGGTQKFYPLDSVTFGDTATSSLSVALPAPVFPTDVVFNHGATTATYTLSGAGSISGPTKLTKDGTGTTILATDNNYTGITDILAGTLQVGNGGLTGSLGTGAIQVASGSTLRFARSGSLLVGSTITGAGALENNGPGTVALTANNDSFTGTVAVNGGTLQLGDGGETGSLGALPVTVASGATFAIKRGGTIIPTMANLISGDGSVGVIGGSANLTGLNSYTGGATVSDSGVLRIPSDGALGAVPLSATSNAIRLNTGGLKNFDSDTVVDPLRGIAINGEAYFTAGWSKSLTIPGPISGSGNVFVNYDSGKVYFTNDLNTWNGVLTLGAIKPGFTGATGGVLEVRGVSNGGVAGPLGAASADPANLVFNAGRLIFNDTLSAGATTTDRGLTLQGSGTIEVVTPTLTINGKITGTGSFTKAGAGTLVLGGNSDFVGEKNISGGPLVMTSVNALGDNTSLVRFTGTAGVLDLATNTSVNSYPVTVGAGNSGTILSNVATPGAGITHSLAGAELSVITLNVAAGANVTGGDPRVSFPSLSLAAGSTGTTTLNPTTANIDLGSVTIGSGNFAKTLALGGTSLTNQLVGSITDGVNVLTLTKVNNSHWTLMGDSSFTGNVTVDDGILTVAQTNALGGQAKTVIIAGDDAGNRTPELRLTGGVSPTVASVQISGTGMDHLAGALRNISGDNTLNITTQMTMRTGNGNTTLWSDSGTLTINTPLVTANATGRALTLAGAGNGVINGVIANGSTGALPVTKNGSGMWTLTGANTYSGATTVNEGMLELTQPALRDTAAVNIAAGASLYLNFTGIDRVGSLVINGVAKPDGVYSVLTDPGAIIGSGSIRVGADPNPSGYSSWASAYPFTAGVNDGPEQDADGDGISNVLEYVLGGIPAGTGANSTSILPTVASNTNNLVFTFRRSDASESDVALKVQWSDGLGSWNDFATIGAGNALPAVQVTEDSPSADLDTVTVTIPKSTAPGGKIFVRLQAIKN